VKFKLQYFHIFLICISFLLILSIINTSEAIEEKLTAEQQIEKRRFEVEVETQEANRKRVEAQGIADSNEIIANSLTQNYLTWYWIQNLDSHNSVIYVPIGESGLPLFKSVD